MRYSCNILHKFGMIFARVAFDRNVAEGHSSPILHYAPVGSDCFILYPREGKAFISLPIISSGEYLYAISGLAAILFTSRSRSDVLIQWSCQFCSSYHYVATPDMDPHSLLKPKGSSEPSTALSVMAAVQVILSTVAVLSSLSYCHQISELPCWYKSTFYTNSA